MMARPFFTTVLYGYFFLLFLPLMGQPATTISKADAPPLSTYTDAAVVWRGFTHQWTYNHRLNRLGNYISNTTFSQLPYRAESVHTSATGVGGDVGLFESQYSYVAMQNVSVQSGVVTIDFSGKEGEMHHSVKHLLIDSKTVLDAQNTQCTVVLNGFDILSEGKADKLSMLHLSVGEAEYLPAANKIRFDLSASLEVTCKSIECSSFNQKFDYTIQIHYLIFSAASQNDLHTTEQTIRRFYNWDKQDELNVLPETHSLNGLKNKTFAEALLAFKSISLQLDQSHWLLDWHSAILPEMYDPQTGKFQYSLDLLFKQWDEDMKHHSANPRISRFSSKKRGWAILEATVCMLQFSNAFVRHADSRGIIKWNGHNQPADADASIQRYPLLLNDAMFATRQATLYQQRNEQQQQITRQYEQYVNELEKKKQQERKPKRK